jgi:hypothetical protein
MSHPAQKCGNQLQWEEDKFSFENRGFLAVLTMWKTAPGRAAPGFAAIGVITIGRRVRIPREP